MGAPKLPPAVMAAINADNMKFSTFVLITLSAIVFSIATYRVAIRFIHYIRTLTCLNNNTQQFFKLPNRTFGWIKQHVLYAPLFYKRHNKQMRIGPVEMGILPSRLQSFLIAGIIAMNVVLCAYGIEWNGALMTKLLHLGNRSGTLAVVNMIPLVFMAGRNNPLIGLLNLPFDTFNLMHRWFGRIVVALVVAHSTSEIMAIVTGETAGKKTHPAGIIVFTDTLKEARFILFGFIAAVAMVTIILTSFTAFRHAFYETFLHIHIALVSLILAGLWIHLAHLPQQAYLKAVVATWVIERLIRLFSLLYRNIGRSNTTADIETLPGDALRVTLRLARPINFKPGSHIFLTIPSIGLWTSHPFSIAWSETSPYYPHDTEKAYPTTTHTTDTLALPQNSVSLIIRRRAGFTNTLYNRTSDTLNACISIPAFVEGPYSSCTQSLSSYGTILLFAGGVGITHQVPFVRDLIAGYSSGTVAARRVTLIWIIQSPEHLEWIRPWMTAILAMPGRREVLRIQLFITQPRSTKEIHSPSATVQMFPGKPSVDALVEMEGREQVGAMGVAVCGPGGLADDVRLAVRRRQGRRNVDFLMEGYGW